MMTNAELKTFIERIGKKDLSPKDVELLVELIRQGELRLVLATGERSLAIGGDAQGVFVTGDGNTVFYLPPPVLEQVRERLREGWFLAHPYALPEGFTGRAQEQAELSHWLEENSEHAVFVLRALGGFGKSALTWYWLHHRVDPEAWPWVVWWPFYDQPDFGAFLEETLAYLGEAEPARLPPREQVWRLLDYLQNRPVLLVLDGFERALRAYGSLAAAYQGDEVTDEAQGRECVDPRAAAFLRAVGATPGRLRGKVLLTTRLRPRGLEDRYGGFLLAGVKERELEGLSPEDAVAYLRGRGLRGRRDELQARAEDYGYHPLSLRLLAGYVRGHRRHPNDIRAAEDLDLTGDLVARRHHILQAAYESLSPAAQKALGALACFRGSVAYEDIKAAVVPEHLSWLNCLRCFFRRNCLPEAQLKKSLLVLEDRNLVHWDREANRYDLHPIVRRYAYDRLTEAERTATHQRLANYFAAVEPLRRVQRLADLAPVIEHYHHLARAGCYDASRRLYQDRLSHSLFYQFGAYRRIIELMRALFPQGEDRPPALSDEGDQAWTLNQLAMAYSLSGATRRAVGLYERHNALREKQGDKRNLAIGLGNLATQHLALGALRSAQEALERGISLCRAIGDAVIENVHHPALGLVLVYRGRWAEAEEELQRSTAHWERTLNVQPLSVIEAYRALLALLRARASTGPARAAALEAAREHAQRALKWAQEKAWRTRPVEHDFIRAYWLLGTAEGALGNLNEAERNLTEALRRCRAIDLIIMEADILLALAQVRAAQGQPEGALRLAEEARVIAERSEYRLQQADIHLFLARLAQEGHLLPRDRKAGLTPAQAARQHAEAALQAAAGEDGPPYHYKVAYDEATELLNELN